MKKWVSMIVTAVVALTLVSCGSADLSLDVESTAKQLIETVTFDEPLEKIDGDIALKLYQLEAEAVTAQAVYAGTAAVVDEVSVWQAKDAAAAKEIEAAVQARIASQKTSYASYRPEEVPKLDAAVVLTKGNYVVLCVSKDSEEAKTVLEELMK